LGHKVHAIAPSRILTVKLIPVAIKPFDIEAHCTISVPFTQLEACDTVG
jgi:hypothetical protein